MLRHLFICLLVAVLGHEGQCRLPNFPDSLASNPEFGGYMNYTEDDRIVGGQEAKMGQFKYQASLQRKRMYGGGSSHYCGASILDQNYIITAAHCVRGYGEFGSKKSSSISVLVGSIDVRGKNPNARPGVKYNVSRILVHERYNHSTVDNDIALIQVEGRITFDEYVQPIKIMKQGGELPITTMCQVSGWGTEEEGGRVSPTLRYVNVPLVSDDTCKVNYHTLTPSMICAGVQEGGKDSCQGDSGGPMVSNGVLVGIVSWGYGCARPGYPGVYARVSQFTNWISSKCQPDIQQ